ncbi:MAG TPA: NifU family protein [Acidimicrobiales bacterium]|nr:NifU family protein [Acidimicrobiales bacterium]
MTAPSTDIAVVTVTDAARDKILELRAQEDDADTLALRIEVTGVNGVEYAYDLSFAGVDEATEDDSVDTSSELTVIVPAASVKELAGATLDLPASSGQGGLVLRNPNRPNPLSASKIELTGTLEEKLEQLLDRQINPALAAHGGFAELKRVVDDTKVEVLMGGGCQGCAVSAMTLRDGIARAIEEAIPEITDVIDVTDHDAGENPFY